MNNLNGILLVILSMVGFTLEDMFIKRLSEDMPTGQILIVLGLVSCVIFVAMIRMQRERIFVASAWRGLNLLRAFCEGASAMAFVTALAQVDLSTVAAVFQATPLVTTMLAALLLKEQVGWRRWSAILVGFLGVMLIIRPGIAGFEPAALWVLIAVFGVALRDVITRRIAADIPSSVVSLQAYITFLIAGTLLLIINNEGPAPIALAHWGMILSASIFGVIAYLCIVIAMRVGEASVVSPFRYSRLLFSILAGALMFGERPDAITLMGASLVIMAGLYTFVREQRLQRARALA